MARLFFYAKLVHRTRITALAKTVIQNKYFSSFVNVRLTLSNGCCLKELILHKNKKRSIAYMKVHKYFEIAKLIAINQGDSKDASRQYRLGAVGIRNDGVLVGASNLCVRHPCPEAHAEYRTAKMLTPKSVVFVVRISKSGEYKNAKPCFGCRQYMKFRGVSKCYYSISEKEYGVLVL